MRFTGYCNSELAGDVDTSKSTSGTMFFLGGCLVCWQSTKQNVMALSSCEAEYIAAASAATQSAVAVQAARGAAGQQRGYGGAQGGQQVSLSSGQEPRLPWEKQAHPDQVSLHQGLPGK